MTSKRKAFVLMPFRQPYDSYYAAIFRPALEAVGFSVTRADDIYTPRPVMLDIQESILSADLLLCELTGRSPNVFYELGLAHAAGKPTILVSTKAEDIPFDLRHVRVINYETQLAGWEAALRVAIEKAAQSVVASENVWPPALTHLANQVGGGQGSRAATVPQKGVELRGAVGKHDPRELDRPINLGFDGAIERGFPHGWFDSVGHVSEVSTSYAVRVVARDDSAPGMCLMMFKTTALPREFASVMQRFGASFLAGRTIRLEGEIRTRDVDGWAGFWLRADGEDVPNIFFDNMNGRRVEGTVNWEKHAVEARLPSDTYWLNIGVIFQGSGVVWSDNLRLLLWNDGTWIDV